MRWPSAWLVASSVLLLAGCGGDSSAKPKRPPTPKIPSALAQRLAAEADEIASLTGCDAYTAAVKFRDEVIANVPRIPARYQEPLTSAANDLTARVPDCAAPQPDEQPKPHGHKKKPKKKHGHHREDD
jgi:hypothetical protein